MIVNGTQIYYLDKKKPVVINFKNNHPKLVASDGYHHTKPLQLNYQHVHTYYFRVECAIDDAQLIVGFIVLIIIYGMAITSDMLVLKLFSFLPVLYFLFLYYINRKEFLVFRSGG